MPLLNVKLKMVNNSIKIYINLCGIIIISAVCSAVKINGLNENIISCICTLFVFLRLIEPPLSQVLVKVSLKLKTI